MISTVNIQGIDYPIGASYDNEGNVIADTYALQDNVNQQINDLKTQIKQTVTNLPDEEDLTFVKESERNVLKLADKRYAPENFSGKGYKILRKNIKEVLDVPQDVILFDNVVNVDYSNKIIDYDSLPDDCKFIRGLVLNLFDNKFYAIIYMGSGNYNVALTWASNKYDYNNYYSSNNIKEGIYKSLLGNVYEYKDGKFIEFTQSSHTDNVLEQDMIPADASILEIKYDFSLSGKPIKFPDNTTLFFNGGKLINGTILGKNIHIINKSGIIFDNVITLGNYNYDIHYYEFTNMSDDDLFTSMTHFDNCYFQAKTYDIYREYGDYDFWVKLNPNTRNYNYRIPNVCNIHGNNACFIIHNDDKRYYTGLIQFNYPSNTNSVVNINNIRIYSNNLIDIKIDSYGASGYFHLTQSLQNSNIVGFTCDNVIAKVNFKLFSTINKSNNADANGNILIIKNSDITCKNYFISEYFGGYKDQDYEIPIKAKSKMILENSKFYSSRDWSFSGINNDADIVVRNCSGKFGFENDSGFKSTIEIYNCNITSLYISPNLERLKISDSIIGAYPGYLGKESYIENTNFIINYNTLDIDIVMSNNLIFRNFNFLKMHDCTVTDPKRADMASVDMILNKGAKLDIYNCTFNSKVLVRYNGTSDLVKIEDLDLKLFYTNTFAGGIMTGNIWIENDNLNPMTSDFIIKEVFKDIVSNKVKPMIDIPIKLRNIQDFIYCKSNPNALEQNTMMGFLEYRLPTTTINENDIINIIINDDMYIKQIVADNTYSGSDLVTFLKDILNADTNYTNKFSVSIDSSLSRIYLHSSVIPFYGEANITINGSIIKPNHVFQPMCPVFTRSDGKGFYKNIGTTEERNNIKFIYTRYEKYKNPVYYDIGFRFFNTDTREYNIYAGNGKWINEKGHPADINYKGTFSEKPIGDDIPIGFEYFCTDKQTVEGTTNGIMIYHKGGGVWVDALGRVVS